MNDVAIAKPGLDIPDVTKPPAEREDPGASFGIVFMACAFFLLAAAVLCDLVVGILR